ncbi:MAG: MarR family transcriptional regulator [Alphaproteobacteria bacterium]|nr:MarR family transcriptional regulator [Alphaproteobacteria bacterium]
MPDRDSLSTEYARVFFRMHRLIDRRMAANGASFARTKLLIFVDRHGPVRAADIAESLALAPRTVTEAIDRLEQSGLVRREPDTKDRRVKWISITDPGRQAIAETEPLRRRFVDQIFGALSEAERAALRSTLTKLAGALDEQEAAEG